MYHLVYLTTNLVNNKFYVGVHSTYTLNDGYLGSGTILKQSINKYGKQNFKRQILYYCLDRQEALDIEYRIVDLNFIKNENTYNIAFGGRSSPHGGFYISDINRLGEEKAKLKADRCSKTIKETLKNKTKEQTQERIDKFLITMEGKSDIDKQSRINKISQSNKNKTEEERAKILKKHITSLSLRTTEQDEEKKLKTKQTINKRHGENYNKGKNNPSAQGVILTLQNGEEIYIETMKNLIEYCNRNNLSRDLLFTWRDKGIIPIQPISKMANKFTIPRLENTFGCSLKRI